MWQGRQDSLGMLYRIKMQFGIKCGPQGRLRLNSLIAPRSNNCLLGSQLSMLTIGGEPQQRKTEKPTGALNFAKI